MTDLTDPSTWRRIGTTVDGLPVLHNPGNDQPSVLDPVSGTWYSPMAYETMRVGKIRAAAEELRELLIWYHGMFMPSDHIANHSGDDCKHCAARRLLRSLGANV